MRTFNVDRFLETFSHSVTEAARKLDMSMVNIAQVSGIDRHRVSDLLTKKQGIPLRMRVAELVKILEAVELDSWTILRKCGESARK